MHRHHLHFNLHTLPPVFTRGRHAIILVTDQQGRIIVGGKKRYPDQIYRMVGGGIDDHEDPQQGAARELAEELHIKVPSAALTPLAVVTADISVPRQQQDHELSFTTYLYHYQLTSGQTVTPNDDIDQLHALTTAEFQQLITRYHQLPQTPDPELGFAWFDWGQVYAQIHQIGLDELSLTQVHSK